jgi:hypothetical protein
MRGDPGARESWSRSEVSHSGRIVGVECLSCGHLAEVPVVAIKRKASPHLLLKQLPYAMRCRRCDNTGQIRLIVGHAIGYEANPGMSVP